VQTWSNTPVYSYCIVDITPAATPTDFIIIIQGSATKTLKIQSIVMSLESTASGAVADRHWKITPNKIWYTVDDANVEDIRKAITSIVITSAQAELENIIKMALDLADISTNMPVIMQGQQGGCRKVDAAVENAYDNYKVIGILLVMAAALILAYCVDVIKAG